MMASLPTGVGLGFRPETALACATRADLAFSEVVAESLPAGRDLPAALVDLLARGVTVIPHGVSLSLGSGARPDPTRLARLRRAAQRLGAPLVSEHVAFVRGAGLETEHLLPVPRTDAMLDVLVDNVRRAQDALGVPLALENVAALFEWPEPQMDEPTFLSALLARTDARLLLDVANLHANAMNFGTSVPDFLDRMPLSRLAYVHVAGGVRGPLFYHDTHAHPIDAGPLGALRELALRVGAVPVLLERDDGFGTRAALHQELDVIAETLRSARPRASSGSQHVAR